jgi:ankyrin repeat protein
MERLDRVSRLVVTVLVSLITVVAARPCEAADNVEEALRARDYRSAHALLEPVAASGDADACYRLASLHLRRDGDTYDPAKAFQWMSVAAEKGHVAARYSLATMYENGDGVAADPVRAKAWLLSAAVAGHPLASRKLELINETANVASKVAEAAPPGTGAGALSALPPLFAPSLAGPYASWPALSIAAWRGDVALVRSLLSQGASVLATDAGGISPLARAVEAGHLDVVQVLLAAGASPVATQRDSDEAPLLNGPAARGDVGMIASLIAAGAEIEPAFEPAPLSVAACAGHTDAVTRLLAAGATPDRRPHYGIKPLACAARANHPATVRVLLAAKARIDSRDSAGRSAIWFAARHGAEAAMRILIKAGADIDAVDRNAISPLAAAASAGNRNSVALLLSAGANLSTVSKFGNSALHAGCAYPAIVKLLLDAGIEKNGRNGEGNTALMIAARLGSTNTVEALLASGANRQLRNRRGENAAGYARATGHEDLARRIERREPRRLGVAALF